MQPRGRNAPGGKAGSRNEKSAQWFLKRSARTCSAVHTPLCFSDRRTDRVPGDSIAAGHATCVSYLCSKGSVHIFASLERTHVYTRCNTRIGVARGIVSPFSPLFRERGPYIDDQVVRRCRRSRTEGANPTFSDDCESGGLKIGIDAALSRKTYGVTRAGREFSPPVEMFIAHREARNNDARIFLRDPLKRDLYILQPP